MRLRRSPWLFCVLAALACAEPELEVPPPPDPTERRPDVTLSLGEASEQDCSSDPARATLPCGVVLGAAAAATLMTGCAPEKAPSRRYWTPDPTVIAQLDENLSLALRLALGRGAAAPVGQALLDAPATRLHPDDFRRQYAGVVVDGRRTVHVSGFHKSRLAIASLRRPDFLSWRTEAVLNCGNESGFFTADYDVSRQRLTGLALSGGR